MCNGKSIAGKVSCMTTVMGARGTTGSPLAVKLAV